MKVPCIASQILLPKKNIDLNKWAVVACDQHTSNPQYWHNLYEHIDNNYSALNLILPECFLHEGIEKRLESIAKCNAKFLEDNIFDTYLGMIYVERTLSSGKVRKGIVAALDLEHYNFDKTEKPLIRASENTVIERLPPRVQIRNHSRLELPHIMVLLDDENRSVIEKLEPQNLEQLYDFELNMGGGHIKGSLIKDCSSVLAALDKLVDSSAKKYGEPLLFAVGDGNHSLAAAKQLYDSQKAEGKDCSLSRYALAEIVNIYDEGLDFEPIHRIVNGVDVGKFTFVLEQFSSCEECIEYTAYSNGGQFSIKLPSDIATAVEILDSVVKEYIDKKGGSVDYIHGLGELKKLSAQENSIGIELKSMPKSALFPHIAKFGVLPKKTFSMGEAEDKRYYMEARIIKEQ